MNDGFGHYREGGVKDNAQDFGLDKWVNDSGIG